MSEAKRDFLQKILSGQATLAHLEDAVTGSIYVLRDKPLSFRRNGRPITQQQFNDRHSGCTTIRVIRTNKSLLDD